MKKILLIGIALLFLFTAPSFAQLGLTLRATGSLWYSLEARDSRSGDARRKIDQGWVQFFRSGTLRRW